MTGPRASTATSRALDDRGRDRCALRDAGRGRRLVPGRPDFVAGRGRALRAARDQHRPGRRPRAGEDNHAALERAYALLHDASTPPTSCSPTRASARTATGSGSATRRRASASPWSRRRALRERQPPAGIPGSRSRELFDLASDGADHELGPRGSGRGQGGHGRRVPGHRGGSHWPPSDMARGPMGFNVAANPLGLDFPYTLVDVGAASGGRRQFRVDSAETSGIFNPLDLYLMGLAAPSEVPPFASWTRPSPRASRASPGRRDRARQAADDRRRGRAPRAVRTPAAAPQTLSTLSVVISRTGLMSDRELAFYDEQVVRGEATAPVLGMSGRSGVETFSPSPSRRARRGRLSTGLGCPGAPAARPALAGLLPRGRCRGAGQLVGRGSEAGAAGEDRGGGTGVRGRGRGGDERPAWTSCAPPSGAAPPRQGCGRSSTMSRSAWRRCRG